MLAGLHPPGGITIAKVPLVHAVVPAVNVIVIELPILPATTCGGEITAVPSPGTAKAFSVKTKTGNNKSNNFLHTAINLFFTKRFSAFIVTFSTVLGYFCSFFCKFQLQK